MKSKHTAGKWVRQGKNIHHLLFDEPLGPQNLVASVPNENPESLANAEHIVDCHNSCVGINPKAVPELLEALKAMKACDGTNVTETEAIINQAEKAIAESEAE